MIIGRLSAIKLLPGFYSVIPGLYCIIGEIKESVTLFYENLKSISNCIVSHIQF